MSKFSTSCGAAAIFISLFATTNMGLASGAADHSHSQAGTDHHRSGTAGTAGDAATVSRTISIVMSDNFYEPESVRIKAGETIRFVVQNKGAFVHEFNVGTPDMHIAHQPEMLMMVQHGVLKPNAIDQEAAKAMQVSMGHGMHSDPNSVLLEPGETGEVIWTFPTSGDIEIEFACNVPGHYESGMLGRFSFN